MLVVTVQGRELDFRVVLFSDKVSWFLIRLHFFSFETIDHITMPQVDLFLHPQVSLNLFANLCLENRVDFASDHLLVDINFLCFLFSLKLVLSINETLLELLGQEVISPDVLVAETEGQDIVLQTLLSLVEVLHLSPCVVVG